MKFEFSTLLMEEAFPVPFLAREFQEDCVEINFDMNTIPHKWIGYGIHPDIHNSPI
jgi:hypothetical protein